MIHHLVAAAMLVAQAGAAERPCLTREEIGDIAISLAPQIVETLATTCRPHLGATSFLNSASAGYVERLNVAAGRRDSAERAFARMSGLLPHQQAEQSSAMDLLTVMATAGIGRAVKAQSCPDVDRILAALAPLPPENLGAMIGAGFALATANQDEESNAGEDDDGEDGGNDRSLSICPA